MFVRCYKRTLKEFFVRRLTNIPHGGYSHKAALVFVLFQT